MNVELMDRDAARLLAREAIMRAERELGGRWVWLLRDHVRELFRIEGYAAFDIARPSVMLMIEEHRAIDRASWLAANGEADIVRESLASLFALPVSLREALVEEPEAGAVVALV